MRVIFYTGKGGSGKSVIAAATALKLSENGYRTLLISTDHTQSVSSLVEAEVLHTPTMVASNFWCLHVDPVQEFRERYEGLKNYVISLFRAEELDEMLFHAFAALPVSAEFISLLKLVEFMELETYDVIVLDTVPSGEALKDIYLPLLLGSNASTLIKLVAPFANVAKVAEPLIGVPIPGEEVIDEDIKVFKILRKLKTVLLDRNVTSLRVIATPDALGIQSLKRTYLLAQLYGINIDLAIINKMQKPAEVGDAQGATWQYEQENYLADLETALTPLPIKKLTLFPPEFKALKLLSAVVTDLFAEEDPARIYFEGKPTKVTESERELHIIVPLPVASKCKDLCDVERLGEDLSVVMSTDMGDVRNFIPLPKTAHAMKLVTAKLAQDELRISFISE